MIDEDEMKHLGRCVELATRAVEGPFPVMAEAIRELHERFQQAHGN